MKQEQATLALDLLNNYVIGFVMEEVRFTGVAENQNSPGSFHDEPKGIEKYPDLEPMMKHLMSTSLEDRFQFGLQTILDGICFRFDLQP
ncbi:tetracycline repressor-like protein [Desmospora activa DSM 45169]|uniref:Tetracycline repressor-like protein n=2 Tax=Desmospora TaxID=500614 RepID=A0A2T4ZBX1_9BACL|nr:tetracycline repressor-like protein [Desmospora activa DSM 45169]